MSIDKTIEMPSKIFEKDFWHGMGGPVDLPIDRLTATAKDFLLARGKYEFLRQTSDIKERATTLLGRNYEVGEVTDSVIKACHFPSFGCDPY